MPNLLVIDVQGAEFKVLKGGINTLKHIDILLTEVNTDFTYKECALISDVDTFLIACGFTKVYQHIWPNHTYGDAIY